MTDPTPLPDDYPHLLMGNPSRATANPAHPDNYLLAKTHFAVSYNNAKGTANWVSWVLKKDDLGTARRAQFYPDPSLPKGFNVIFPRDYNGTGFDRGHLCPRSDRTATPEAAQRHVRDDQHRAPVAEPESEVLGQLRGRTAGNSSAGRARRSTSVAGPSGKGGEGLNGHAETIARGKVTVPAKCWKVVLVVQDGDGTVADITRLGRRRGSSRWSCRTTNRSGAGG